MTKLILAVSIVGQILIAPNVYAATAEFLEIAQGPNYSFARGVSDDGSTVVGSYFGSPFYWTRQVGTYPLPGGSLFGDAVAASADGSILVGSGGGRGLRWQSPFVQQPEQTPPHLSATLHAVSDDGTVIAGQTYFGNEYQAMRWTASTGIVQLGTLGLSPRYDNNSIANGISADGSIVVGRSTSPNGNTAYRWTESSGMQPISQAADKLYFSVANDISSNGNVIVGLAGNSLPWQAVRWSAASGVVGLGYLRTGDHHSEAKGVSADGSVIVGESFGAGHETAVIWTERNGMRSIKDILVGHGLDLSRWRLTSATDVSANGRVVVGYGVGPGGQSRAWVAILPVPEPRSFCLATSVALVAVIRRSSGRIIQMAKSDV